MPFPASLCMMKPSPPKNPAPIFFWKAIESSTPVVEARNAFFWAMSSLPEPISTGLIAPVKLEAKAMVPGPPSHL